MPHQGDHDVREILTDALAGLHRIVDLRIHLRAPLHIVKTSYSRTLISCSSFSGSSRRTHVQFLRQPQQHRRRLRELARQQHLPVVALRHQSVQFLPRIRRQLRRNGRQRLVLHQRLRYDHHLRMPSRNIEMMDVIAQMIPIREHPAPRAHRQMSDKQR